MAPFPVTKEIYIEAPAKVVYEVLTDPDHITQWMGVAGSAEAGAGDFFRLSFLGSVRVRRNYVESTSNQRVVFTWAWRKNGQKAIVIRSKVEIDLESKGEGTWVRLTHRELPKPPKKKAESRSRAGIQTQRMRPDKMALYRELP